MWGGSAGSLRMTEGDYGITLPFKVSGADLGVNDSLKFVFKKKVNGEAVIEKTYEGIVDNTAPLCFTEAESAELKPGVYVYSLDWYQDGSFLCNIIEKGSLEVEEKV